ncbi:JmjC domain-containing protein [Kitasatospora sp. NPDC127067]|uniref:JmjC domain-containing protein n=1 Tax=Kitasatospora sp. NPDC127067 TaxID=3347126 RepID=UPI0036496C67
MNYTPSFSELVGDEDEFFREYFNKKPLLRRGVLTERARDILSARDLDDLLHSEVIRPPHIAVTKAGMLVHGRTYTSEMRVQREYIADRVIPERVIEHFKTGATITWNSLNHIKPNIRQLTSMLSEKFAGRSDAVAFVTPAGRRGFRPHHDSVDLFIIQLEGTKDWQVWSPPEVRKGDAAWFELEELGEPAVTVRLEPGDVLYLPYNSPHVAAANDAISIHLSVMVRPRRWSDLLQDLVKQVTQDNPEFWGYPHLSVDNDGFAEELVRNLSSLAKNLGDLDAAKAIQSLREEPEVKEGSKFSSYFADQVRVDELAPGSLVVRDFRTDIDFMPSDEQDAPTVQVSVNGSVFAFPRPVAEELRAMGEQTRQTDTFITGAPGHENTSVTRTLLRLGVLKLVG